MVISSQKTGMMGLPWDDFDNELSVLTINTGLWWTDGPSRTDVLRKHTMKRVKTHEMKKKHWSTQHCPVNIFKKQFFRKPFLWHMT